MSSILIRFNIEYSINLILSHGADVLSRPQNSLRPVFWRAPDDVLLVARLVACCQGVQ